MHLYDIVAQRAIAAAGISVALTRRCPLHCDHCGTESTMESEEAPAAIYEEFFDTFTVDDHPSIVAISGGEAFLRPRLLRDLARHARSVGCSVSALSGMYWARGGRIPASIRAAIGELDHFAASIDVFHEREVPRADVFAVLGQLLSDGMDVSIALTGLDGSDPYVREAAADIEATFGDRVPMIVNRVNPTVGRAREWAETPVFVGRRAVEADPCTLAFWPVVGYDGTITACGNDDVVAGPAPAHLRLGHCADDPWPAIRERCESRAMLRALRTFGPEWTNERAGSGVVTCDGFCSTCRNLSDDPAIEAGVELLMSKPGSGVVERHAIEWHRNEDPETFVRRHALPEYAHLVAAGRDR